MNKKDAVKNLEIIKAYKKSCDELASRINEQLFDNSRKWFWVADEIGGVCDFEEADIINAEDMVRILENGMSYDDYAEWRDANIDNNRYINLKSWLMGARHDMFKAEE